jgi:hypothetical protein
VSFDGTWLVCAFCHRRWNTAVLADELHLDEGIENLVGTAVLTGAKGIDPSSLVTVECDGCGATITINSENTLHATCHWCRQVLSLNNPVDNGAIPDAILPFTVTREEALRRMQEYLSDRAAYASPGFMRDFETPTIQAVYLPYLVVDGVVTVRFDGRALTKVNVDQKTFSPSKGYFIQRFNVMREVDLVVNDLAIEARSTRTRNFEAVSTTNIINAIQPFDVGKAVRFDASYIAEGIVFERRDMEVAAATGFAADHFTTIARSDVDPSLAEYSGVCWEAEQTEITGTRWVSMLLPVWVYAFKETTWTGRMMHYIAVNGRTGETEGSIPVASGRASRSAGRWGLRTAAIAVPLLIVGAILASGFDVNRPATGAALLVGLFALIYAGVKIADGVGVAMHRRAAIIDEQRSPDARLKPECETQHKTTRLVREDKAVAPVARVGDLDLDGRNDQTPQLRVANWMVTVKEDQSTGPAPAGDSTHGDFPASIPVSADAARLPPPSTTVLSVGWKVPAK